MNVNFSLFSARKSDAKLQNFSLISKLFLHVNASFSTSSKTVTVIDQDSNSYRPNTANTLRATAVKNTCDGHQKYLRRPLQDMVQHERNLTVQVWVDEG